MTRSPLSVFVLAACSCLSALPATPLRAQDELPLDRLIFEASPLPGTAAPAQVPLRSATNAAPIAVQRPQPLALLVPAAPAFAPASLPGAALPAELLGEFDADGIDRYLASIDGEQLRGGPYAPALREQFLALGEAYQQQGEHEQALEAFAKAEYVSRINAGLHDPQQFAIVENMIESHLALGEFSAANQRQNYLLMIKREYYGEGSVEVVPALEAVGDWNMAAFNAGVGRGAAPLPEFAPAAPRPGRRHRSPQEAAFDNLFIAQRSYHSAMANLVANRRYTDPRLLALEYKLIEGAFLGSQRQAIVQDADFYLGRRVQATQTRIARSELSPDSAGFANGRDAWMRLRFYVAANPASTPADVARTIIGLGDWYMLFNSRPRGLEQYREAWRYLEERGTPATEIAALLAPAVPQQLPAFTALPHSRAFFGMAADAPLNRVGYIDVRFTLSHFGNVLGIDVIGKSANVTPRVERRLRRLLNSSPFRPWLRAGEPDADAEYALRFDLALAPPLPD